MARKSIVEVDFNAAAFTRDVRSFTSKQGPFVIARALTWTVQDTQDELVGDLPSTFTIRSGWVQKGIRIRPATKRRLGAIIGSIDDFMRRQAVGDIKEPDASVGDHLGVPVKARKTPQTKITPGLWPSRLIAKRRTFSRPAKSGSGRVLFQVLGRRKKRKGTKTRRRAKSRTRARKERLRLLYILAPKVHVPKRWPLEATLRKVARKRWAPNMRKSWKMALRSRRRR